MRLPPSTTGGGAWPHHGGAELDQLTDAMDCRGRAVASALAECKPKLDAAYTDAVFHYAFVRPLSFDDRNRYGISMIVN